MNTEPQERSQKWLNESIRTVEEKIANGPPYDFDGPLAICITMIEDAPALGIKLFKTMAETGHEQSLVFLGEIYLDGKIHLRDGVLADKNPDLGNSYLMKAAELGSTTAMLKMMGEYYIQDGELKYRDPEKALYWLKRAADAGCETANESWADHLVNGRTAQDCAQREIEEIEKYYQRAHYTFPKFYKLARFHSDGLLSGDYSGDEYERARYWLHMGVSESRHNSDREPCEELRRAWGIEGVAAKESTSNGMFILQVVAGGVGLVLFAVLGSFIVAAAGSIMTFTVPALIIGYILYKLYGVMFPRG
jgi:hypothetical protein